MNPTDALDRISIVLSRTSHPGNIGSVARAMKTMGLSRLVLVSPKYFPHPEADTLASGASDILLAARVCDSLDEALAGSVFSLAVSARIRDLGPMPQLARGGAASLVAQCEHGRVALVFGNETSGLSNEDVQRCHGTVSIAANPVYSSLNLAAAVQVLCYELRMAAFEGADSPAGKATPFSSPPATYEEQEGFYAHLEQVMVRSGFLDPVRPRRLMPKLRRLFSRARLEKDEVNILRGILAAVDGSQVGRSNS